MHPVSCSNTHHDDTDLLNYKIVKNAKTWIYWECNLTFHQNKKALVRVSDDTLWEVIVL